ncbi:hypothetical protein Tco_1119675 [Tanacetum coccineum]
MGRDTIQLQDVMSTITPEYLLEFTSEFRISEDLHPDLPGVEHSIMDFPEGTVGVYTRFFDFANYRIPISQFLFDILGYYQIHLSQLSVIGAAKVSHFEINCRVHRIIPTVNLFRVFYIPSYNSGWMSFSKRPEKNTPQCYTKPLDSLKNWNNRFFWVDERVFPTIVEWRASAPKDGLPKVNTYRAEDVEMLNTRRTSIQKQSELLLCLVGLSRNYLLGDDEYPTFQYDDGREMDLFNLIRAPNPTKAKTGTLPRLAHKIPLLVQTARRMISMDVPSGTSESAGTSSTLWKSPLDFDGEDPSLQMTKGDRAEEPAQEEVAPAVPAVEVPETAGVEFEPVTEKVIPITKKRKQLRRKRKADEVEGNAPAKVLRKDHPSAHPERSTRGEGSVAPTPEPAAVPTDSKSVSDAEPLSYAKPSQVPEQGIAQSSQEVVGAPDPDSEKSMSFTSMSGSPGGIYQPGWGVTNSCRLYTSGVCQEIVDHIAPPGFKQEVKLLKKAKAQVARRDQRIQAIESEKSNLETVLEAEVDMKKVAEAKNAELSKELKSLCAQFSDLLVSHDGLSQQVATLQAQVSGEEKIKASLEEFKKLEDEKLERRCAEMDARLDALSVDFDKELYPHMLTAGRRWVIGHGFRLVVMKCAESVELRQKFADVVTTGIAKGMSEGLKHGVGHERAQLDLDALEAYDPEADTKFTTAF